MLDGRVKDSRYPLSFHCTPEEGLLNDPNGLIEYQGAYHLFYQWNSKDCSHDYKSWGHVVSQDMIHWKRLPVALVPSEPYDKDGIYSGSAIEKDGKLYLFYTGNVINPDRSRSSFQCWAVSENGVDFKKLGPLFEHPQGYTRHVRDPKVWFDNETHRWRLVLGAQTLAEQGTILCYSSADFKKWQFDGELFDSNEMDKMSQRGYMWECPDLFQVDGQELLLYSPQGLTAEREQYQNIHQTVYLPLTKEWQIASENELVEMDWGFEFYAPQTFETADERRILYGWMGVMPPEKEQAQPTVAEKWVHCLTIPRELNFHEGRLYQRPIRELQQLRGEESTFGLMGDWKCPLAKFGSEILMTFDSFAEDFQVEVTTGFSLLFDAKKSLMELSRTNWEDGKKEFRHYHLDEPLKEIQLMIDGSAVEIFVNHGVAVASARFFALEKPLLKYNGKNQGRGVHFSLLDCR
ncbi:glycoside hydrolase family 32 protein [Enterococcus thailandicus]|uniref:glycoside hydrolase family 32 protein n=1 Tax=Enterococcus thailandicus TaxID=417368 RepID=UPI0032E52004